MQLIQEVGGQIRDNVIGLSELSPSAVATDVTIPANAALLTFDFRFSNPGDGDWVTVSFNDTLLFSFRGESFIGSDFQRIEIPVGNLAGQTGILTVKLNDSGLPNAEVMVSNFQFLSSGQDTGPPTITGFTPSSGPVGMSVMITGTNFTGVTAVMFNGVSASFTVISPTQIIATVPAGATTGPISVTTSRGTATTSSTGIPNFNLQAILTVTRAGSGDGIVTGTGINCGTDCSEPYTGGTSVILTAAADSVSTFARWSGCELASGTSCTVMMNANRSVTAVFSRIYSDDPLTPQVTPVKALHITQLRSAIDTLRSRAGLGGFTWTTPTPAPGRTILAADITDLRTALNAVYDALLRARPTYTDSTIVPGQTPIKATHITQIRNAVRNAE